MHLSSRLYVNQTSLNDLALLTTHSIGPNFGGFVSSTTTIRADWWKVSGYLIDLSKIIVVANRSQTARTTESRSLNAVQASVAR